MSCQLVRETLESELKASGYGANEIHFAAYFVKNAEGSVVCVACNRPIGNHESSTLAQLQNPHQSSDPYAAVSSSPSRHQNTIPKNPDDCHLMATRESNKKNKHSNSGVPNPPWSYKRGRDNVDRSQGDARDAGAYNCNPWCMVFGPLCIVCIHKERVEFDLNKKVARNIKTQCLAWECGSHGGEEPGKPSSCSWTTEIPFKDLQDPYKVTTTARDNDTCTTKSLDNVFMKQGCPVGDTHCGAWDLTTFNFQKWGDSHIAPDRMRCWENYVSKLRQMH